MSAAILPEGANESDSWNSFDESSVSESVYTTEFCTYIHHLYHFIDVSIDDTSLLGVNPMQIGRLDARPRIKAAAPVDR